VKQALLDLERVVAVTLKGGFRYDVKPGTLKIVSDSSGEYLHFQFFAVDEYYRNVFVDCDEIAAIETV
jgi:hypothetical protein